MKKIAWEEDFIHEVNLCYIYWIKQTQQTQPCMIFFFISKSTMLKKKKKQKYIITIREALRKEKGNQKQPFAWSTSSSWDDVLGFKEIYSIIFKTNPSVRENTRKEGWEIWECEKVSLLEHKRMWWILGSSPYL